MKFPLVFSFVVLATVSSSPLLEISQELWSRILNGGYRRIGKLDPLYIPVIRVDQSEGNTTYRVILHNLEVAGLNNSRIESVHVVRGQLKSNLSDNEAGYVSYNEQHGMDSVRYRFHSLIKERKSASHEDPSANNQFARFMESDPMSERYREEEDLIRSGSQDSQRQGYYANFDGAQNSRRGNYQQQEYDTVLYPRYQPGLDDMKVLVDPVNPSSVRVVYTHNYRNNDQGEYARPCVGACRPNYASNVRAQETQHYPHHTQQGQYLPNDNVGIHTRYHYDQHHNADRINDSNESAKGGYGMRAQFGGSSISSGTSTDGQRRNEFLVEGGSDSGVNYSANFGNDRFGFESNRGENYGSTTRPNNQFSVKGSDSGIRYSGNYESDPISLKESSGGNYESNTRLNNQPTVKGGANQGIYYSDSYNNGPISVDGNSGMNYASTARPGNQFLIKGGRDSEINYSGRYQNGPISVGVKNGYNDGSTVNPNNQFSVKSGGNSEINYSGSYRNGAISVNANSGQNYASTANPNNQFSIKGGKNSGINYSGSYRNGQYSIESQNGDHSASTVRPQNQFSVKGGSNSGVNYSGSFKNGQFAVESNSGSGQNQFGIKGGNPNRGSESSASNNYEMKSQIGAASISAGNSGVKGGNDQRPRIATSTGSPNVEQFEPYKSPLIRMEKKPGYVDIVYAKPAQQSNTRRSENLKTAPEMDPRVLGFEDIVKELPAMDRIIAHNLTDGKSLNCQNDAARVAVETRRIKDMIRYAKEYQEKQGFYEEGVEFTYHFGSLKNDSNSNETLTRKKRQHATNKEEDDVMHVVVRIHVPMLSVKSGYALQGEVGRRQIRGNGLLAGNFTDVIADFTVELKKVNNQTMIVRAARAKLVSKDRKVGLEGVDDTGAVESILSHGLMAAEAVAAMIVDDLATRALNEDKNAETMIYKMYKNLPIADKD